MREKKRYYKKKARKFNLILIIVFVYRLNILVFMMKLVLYLYARLLLSVLYTVLVIPRDQQVPHRQAENTGQRNFLPVSNEDTA